MNRRVVAATAAGLGTWLLEHEAHPSVVIGHDARHQSDLFARDLAEVLSGSGVQVTVLPGPLPTPVLAFAIGHLGTAAGVMVTASHNPATDNGLKVYLADGSQIASPIDAEIAACIAEVGDLDALPRSIEHRVAGEVVERYIDVVVELVGTSERAITVAYTPLHGVGAATFLRAAHRAGFANVQVVESQAEPDADFPTTAFPNPEEPCAMDAVLALGAEIDADIVLAHDPDADRCAVAAQAEDGLRVLTGDELGILLADHLMREGRIGTYASSLVSSKMLGELASARELPWSQTLTGFKWIGKVPGLAFGYEEALGYCVAPHLSRDKDGIAAALVLLDLADRLRADGHTLLDRLDELFRAHGAHVTTQVAVRLASLDEVWSLMEHLYSHPAASLGPAEVRETNDLRQGYRDLPPTDGLRLAFNGGRVIIRPSGTEPKLKCYVEVVDRSESQARDTAEAISAALRDYLAAATRTGTSR